MNRSRVMVPIALLLTLAGCGGPATDGTKGGYLSGDGSITTVPPGERKPAPDLSGLDLDGTPISSDRFAGKILVVNVWGSWCPPCRKEAPALAEVSRKLKPQGVEFLGIDVREPPEPARAFDRKMNTPYPSISDEGGKLLVGFNHNLPTAAIPTTYVIDRNGRVAVRILDASTVKTLTDVITDVIKEH